MSSVVVIHPPGSFCVSLWSFCVISVSLFGHSLCRWWHFITPLFSCTGFCGCFATLVAAHFASENLPLDLCPVGPLTSPAMGNSPTDVKKNLQMGWYSVQQHDLQWDIFIKRFYKCLIIIASYDKSCKLAFLIHVHLYLIHSKSKVLSHYNVALCR